MYAAITSDGQIIYANEMKETAEQPTFYCPTCQQVLTHKISSTGKGYFSHLTSCQNDLPARHTQESETHLTAKRLLQNTLEASGYAVQIEHPIEIAQQIADVYLLNSHSLTPRQVIEFQRVPIGAELIRSRTQNYLQAVDKCTWLIDEEVFKGGYRQTWLQTMVAYSSVLGFHWQALNVSKREWVIKFKMPIIYQAHRIQLSEKRLDLDVPLYNVWEFPENYVNDKVHYPLYRRPQRQSTYYRQIKQIMTQSTYQKAIRDLYAKGVLLQTLPQWMVMERWQMLVFKSPGWLCLAWCFYLISQCEHDSFTKTDLENGIHALVQAGHLVMADMPLIEEDLVSLLVPSLVNLFLEKELIERAGYHRWKLHTKVHS
ncbi:competence protein CoiA [Fundicoccus sp. Sow4_D5]|uniref:competence protein CoiA n=1 Tax=Fundicoccus sp. Sow4_D5 TaxID=3438782 RepID=UPI003F91FB26